MYLKLNFFQNEFDLMKSLCDNDPKPLVNIQGDIPDILMDDLAKGKNCKIYIFNYRIKYTTYISI